MYTLSSLCHSVFIHGRRYSLYHSLQQFSVALFTKHTSSLVLSYQTLRGKQTERNYLIFGSWWLLVKCMEGYILLLLRRYNSDRVLAFSAIAFHLRRSCPCSAHFVSFIFFRSFLTSSSHRFLGLPADLPVNGFHLCILFTMLVSGILFMCPNQLNRCVEGYITLRKHHSLSRWPRGLWWGSAASCLLGLRVGIQPGAWNSVSCECCVLSGRGLCGGPIPRPE